MTKRSTILTCAALVVGPYTLHAQKPPSPAVQQTGAPVREDSVTIRVVNTEVRTAMQLMGQYLDRPIIVSGPPSGALVTLETPRPVPRRDVPRLLRALLDSQNYELIDDTTASVYRVRPREPRTPAQISQGFPQATGSATQRLSVSAPELFVISLKHARATDVAGTVNALFGRATSDRGVRPPTSRVPTINEELRDNQIAPVDAAPLSESIPNTAGRAATLTGELSIVPDTRTNSLLIRANRNDFTLIQAAVQQLDVRPLQVLIEVMIVEAQKNYNFNFGIDASVDQQHIKNTQNTTLGGSTQSGFSDGLGALTLHLMGASGIDVDATVNAAADHGDVHIISRPTVLAANNEKAEVVVGSQRPFVQLSRTLPTDAGVQDQVVQYKDVGTKLSVTPTISTDGSVQLSLTQEVSNATTETQFNAPVISNRSVRTELLVHDGQTIVLGGLRDREVDTDRGGIPFLSSIPVLGGIFGHYTRTTTETELYIFMTPHVIRTDDDVNTITDPLRKSADKKKP